MTESVTTDLRFVGEWKFAVAVTVALALAIAVWLLYWRESRARRDYLRWLLPTLRAVAVFWLLMMLSGPVLHHRKVIGELARVMVFADASQSMAINDEHMDVVRKLLIAQQLGWLPANKFDEDLQRTVQSLARAQQMVRSARAEMDNPELNDLARKVADEFEQFNTSLGKVRPDIWKAPSGVSGKIARELVEPAKRLSRQEIGNNPRKFVADLNALLTLGGQLEKDLLLAFNDHVRKVTGGNDTSIQDALGRFDSMPRWKRLETMLLEGKENLLTRLAETHNVELAALQGNKAEMLWWPGAPGTEGSASKFPETLTLAPNAVSTDLSTGIRGRVDGSRADERVAVVLFSDGQHNAGPSPVQTAKLLGTRTVPMFVVGLGSADRPPDLAITEVKGPDTVFQEANVGGTIELKDDAPPGQPFLLRIEYQGKLLWEKKLITEQRSSRSVTYDFPIKELVKAELVRQDKDLKVNTLPLALKVSASPVKGEQNTENNSGTLYVSAITERPKVLLADGRPRWEFRYLRNLLERDQKWEVNALAGGFGSDIRLWLRGTQPGQFPKDRESLFAYQLIILGDLPANALTPTEMEWVREFVERRGGGVIFVDGPRESMAALLNTPLKPLLPVTWMAQGPNAPFKLRFAASGALQAAFGLNADAAVNAELWTNLQPPRWTAAVQPLPGAEVIVELNADGRAWPGIVFQRYGAGKVLYCSFEESWRWRYEIGDVHHQKFWNQAAKWIMEAPFPVQDKFVSLDSGPLHYAPGEAAELRVRLRDAQGRLVLRAKAEASLYRDGKRAAVIPLIADENTGGNFRARTPSLEPGNYEVRVRVDGFPEEEMKARTTFTVAPQGAGELSALHCDEDLLRQLAFQSGGAYYREEEIGLLFDRLKPLSQGKIQESDTLLWQSWWWFIPIVTLLTLEWVFRKRAGML
ncbi:MAG: hypothetical protein AB1705_18620 [Verrucomicrobiota bacterium]